MFTLQQSQSKMEITQLKYMLKDLYHPTYCKMLNLFRQGGPISNRLVSKGALRKLLRENLLIFPCACLEHIYS